MVRRRSTFFSPTTNATLHILADNATTTSSCETLSRYYVARCGEAFKDGRYLAIQQVGTGRYSHVWLAQDLQYVCARL